MKIAIIRASDLAREGRWDAKFHIALAEVRERVEELKNLITDDEARTRLDGIALTDKAPLLVLGRGGSTGTPPLNTKTIERITKEYPHLSLAIMEKNLQPAIERLRTKIEADQKHLNALLALETSSEN